jgi:hypothetical protein
MGFFSSLLNSFTESGVEHAYRIYSNYGGSVEGMLREYKQYRNSRNLSEEYRDRYARQICNIMSSIKFVAINGSPRDAQHATELYKHLQYRYEDVFDELNIQKLTV